MFIPKEEKIPVAACKSNNRKLACSRSGNIWIQKSKAKVSFVILATFGEERDLKNLKSCCTSKGLGGVRLKSKDIELIFFHLHTKIQQKKVKHIAVTCIPCQVSKSPPCHCVLPLCSPHCLTLMAPVPVTLTSYLILIPFCSLDLP